MELSLHLVKWLLVNKKVKHTVKPIKKTKTNTDITDEYIKSLLDKLP